MASKDDLSGFSEAQLVAEYVENVQSYDAIEHVGAANRHFDRRIRIVDELKRRSGDTVHPLHQFLDHEDPKVRLSAATWLRTIDHAAFERVARALATRTDEIGEDAKRSLEVDARFEGAGDREHEPDAPPRPLPPQVRWQSQNPPPPAMPRDEIEALLADAVPGAAARLMPLAQAAIGLWPQVPPPNLPIHASRLGGMPHAPPGWQWPMDGGEPMLFLGHINCAELRGLPGAEALPSSGILAFFGDHDVVTGCLMTALDVAVFHWPQIDRLVPVTPPIELMMVLPLCALAWRPLIDLPDPYSDVVQSILTDQDQLSRYAAARDAVRYHAIPEGLGHYCSSGKLLGWPNLVQWHDLDLYASEADRKDFRLLLQLDDYSNGEECSEFGPGGSLYFMIPERDLRERRFDRCGYDRQFT